jgi:DNA-binding transcriptional LysR family regulator
VSIRRVLEIGSREAMIQAVARGIGIGIALEEEISMDKRLKSIKVTNADITLHSQVVCLQERRNSPLIKAFLSVVKDLIAIR